MVSFRTATSWLRRRNVIESAAALLARLNPPMLLRPIIISVLVLVVSGCTVLDNFGVRQSKNPNPTMADVPESGPWFCYGVASDKSWDCSTEKNDAKIARIVPGTETAPIRAPAAPVEPLELPVLAARPTPIALPEPEPPQSSVKTSGGDSAAHVLNTPADYFAVQLIAMRDKSRVEGYATANGITDPMIIPVINQDQQWHLLLLGTFETREAAVKARDEWESTRILKVRPWIRRVKPLQDAITASSSNG